MYKKIVLVASAVLTIERPPPALAVLSGICEHNNVSYEVFDLNIFLLEHFGHEEWRKIANIFSSMTEIKHDNNELINKVDRAMIWLLTKCYHMGPI